MVTIQRLGPGDGEPLAGLYLELAGRITDRDQMKVNLSWISTNPDYYLLGAKNDRSELLGSLMGIMCRDIVGSCRPFMVLENVIVAAKYRRQGIGSQLLKWIEKAAEERDCYYIMFVSASERKAAHKFYESLGYKLDGVQGFKKYLLSN